MSIHYKQNSSPVVFLLNVLHCLLQLWLRCNSRSRFEPWKIAFKLKGKFDRTNQGCPRYTFILFATLCSVWTLMIVIVYLFKAIQWPADIFSDKKLLTLSFEIRLFFEFLFLFEQVDESTLDFEAIYY